MTRKTKVLIVDDHPIILNGLKNMFKNLDEITVSDIASNGKQALKILSEKKIDIVVSDLQMPEMDGFELITRIKKRYPYIKVMVLSMHNDIWRIKKLLSLDVSAILSKSLGELEMKKALNAINNNEKYYDEHTKAVIVDLVTNGDTNSMDPSRSILTDREIQIIQFIYEGLTTKEIAERMNKSRNTIETHRKNMFFKCGVKNIAGLIKYGIKKGYILPD